MYKRAWEIILFCFFSIYYRDYGSIYSLFGWPIWPYPLMIFFLECNHSIISSPFDCSKQGLEVIFKNILSLINIINEPPSHLAKSSSLKISFF